jgi:pseudaminic acid biosynthesis-associated methylase
MEFMMNSFKTEQEVFWAGSFGDEYVSRNQSAQLLASNLALFSKIIPRTTGVKSLIEFGANIGMNLHAFKTLLPNVELSAIEINQHAVTQLNKLQDITVYPQSILDFTPTRTWDMVLVKGVLIHINPETLKQVYQLLYRSSSRYLCVAEYYNPSPVEVMYRGHSGKLFKRDFAGELLDEFPDLKLVDYGFAYHGDTYFPQDDITWFLLEKSH